MSSVANTIESAFNCTPRQLAEFLIEDILPTKLVAFITGSPGVGKSAIVTNVANKLNLQLIDHRLSTSSPEDLSGLPAFKAGKASFMPFDIFPTEDTPLPPGKDGWLLFLDEFNSAAKSVQAAAYKLILDKQVGQYKLHPRVKIVAAGNKATDRAIVNSLSTAMTSRLIHLHMEVSHKEWLEDVAIAEKYDSRVIAYLNYKPGHLMDFSPDTMDGQDTFCCPRTWSFVNDLIKGKEYNIETIDGASIYPLDRKASLYTGAITSGVATSFIQFTRVFSSLPSIASIVIDPTGVPVPTDTSIRWSTIASLAEKVDNDTFENVCKYINRFTADMRVLFYRMIILQKPALKSHPAFRGAMSDLMKYLYD